jgi:hypothetical protein
MKKLFFLLMFPILCFGQSISIVNNKVLEYVDINMGKKVDRGQCWDLAKYALDYAGADWISPYNFGEKINYKNSQIYPGDIIQFENVKLTFKNGYANYPHHTAVVYKVKESRKFIIAHQNSNGIKKVHTQELDLNKLSKGKVIFYRPI